MNESNNDFKKFLLDYKGAIIGGLIAIIIACTGLVRILVVFAIIVFGIWVGNYVQRNKEKVKEKLKNLIDRF